MNASISIEDTGTEQGWRWTVRWEGNRRDTGYCATRTMCHEAVKRSLDRELQSREIHEWYDECRVAHRDSGD